MRHVLAGVAIAALVATSAQAEPGKGHGKSDDHGKPAKAHVEARGGSTMRDSDHGQGQSMKAVVAARADRNGPTMKAQASARRDDARGKKDQGGKDKAPSQAVAHRNDDKARKPEPRGDADRAGNRDVRVESRADAGRDRVRVLADGRHRYETRGQRVHFDFSAAPRGLVDGCPPGLAKKHNGCMPPGLARNDVRYRFVRNRPDWWGFPRLAEGRYFYDDGYLMRLSGDRVVSYLPLFGGALSVGNRWPSFYTPLAVPDYYVDYYDLGPPGSYRYADNVLYRVDPTTAAITSVAALLTGNDIRIGSPMPLGYDVYNVPYPYRSMYYDSPDAYYRYSDGYIYQLDPTTRLVTAAIDLLAT